MFTIAVLLMTSCEVLPGAVTGGAKRDSAAIAASYSTLEDVEKAIDGCGQQRLRHASGDGDSRVAGTSCGRVIYILSSLMPLSSKGLEQVLAATRDLGVPLHVVDASALYQRLDGRRALTEGREALPLQATAADSMTSALVAAGGTIHFPSLVVYRGGRMVGDAILGYRTAAAYSELIAHRLGKGGERSDRSTPPRSDSSRTTTRFEQGAGAFLDVSGSGDPWQDVAVNGPVGSYFRWWPGTSSVVFEMREKIYVLDLGTGDRLLAPGYVDFIPSPDGRVFVTPRRDDGGLEFYDARAVRRALSKGESALVRPAFVDTLRPDQYPSIAVLSDSTADGARMVRYRVLTAWFRSAAFRDYRVTIRPGTDDGIVVQPAGALIPICPGLDVSLPIIAADGRTIGGRDEATGTTKLFKIDDAGRCRELLDLGMPTGKVAFHRDGRRIAFAIPDGAMAERPELDGVFILDTETLLLSKVPGSAQANRLTFPDFTADGIVFLLAGEKSGWSSRFRSVPLATPSLHP